VLNPEVEIIYSHATWDRLWPTRGIAYVTYAHGSRPRRSDRGESAPDPLAPVGCRSRSGARWSFPTGIPGGSRKPECVVDCSYYE